MFSNYALVNPQKNRMFSSCPHNTRLLFGNNTSSLLSFQ
jgi:hypothetical protein